MPIFGRKKDKHQEAAKLLSNGNVQKAIERFREVIDEKPDHVNARVGLAVALLQAQDEPTRDSPETVEALALLDEASELAPDDPIPHFNRGVFYRKLGMSELALESFATALEIQEKIPLALLHIAEIHYELENYEEAIEYARKAIYRDPGMASAVGWVKDAMRKAGMLDDGGNIIEKA